MSHISTSRMNGHEERINLLFIVLSVCVFGEVVRIRMDIYVNGQMYELLSNCLSATHYDFITI